MIIETTLAASLLAGVLVIVFANRGNDQAGKLIRCFLGFFVAVVWIMAIADEVVNVLQVSGIFFFVTAANWVSDFRIYLWIIGCNYRIVSCAHALIDVSLIMSQNCFRCRKFHGRLRR